MPFLVPASVALVSDAVVLFLSRLRFHDDDDDSLPSVYRVGYLVPLACLRMGLLLVPLLFYSYTGTALRYQKCYSTLYGLSFLILVVHALGLLATNPESLESLVPRWGTDYHSSYNNSNSPHTETILIAHYHWLRRAWYMILLSLVSTACHGILVMHVQSTAPNPRQSMAYLAVRSTTASSNSNSTNQQSTYPGVPEPAVLQAMNEFMGDVQQRLQRAKEEWALRLEDFGLHADHGHANGNGVNHNNGMPTTNNQAGGGLLRPVLTPFRVLLSLFAYQDVLDNGQLDTVFAEDAAALTRLCPQLLGFLLHGAYTSSPALEQWILTQCGHNLYFAHQCYWFLRSWCLQVPTPPPGRTGTPQSLSRCNSAVSGASTTASISPTNATHFLDEPASPAMDSLECWNPSAPSSAASFAAEGSSVLSNNKLLPGERILITALMERVQEYGQIPAQRLEFGDVDSEGQVLRDLLPVPPPTPAQILWATNHDWIPLDPHTNGNPPSAQHLANLNAKQYFTASNNMNTNNSNSPTAHFDATPQFLDNLLHLAESLFLVPRENRKEELRRALTAMECEWLPSNCLYLPVGGGNGHHKVWRIAVSESFPIHTKERVPCIICFEVLDGDPKQQQQQALNSTTKTTTTTSSSSPPRTSSPMHSNWLFRQVSSSSDAAGLRPPAATGGGDATSPPTAQLDRAPSLDFVPTTSPDASEADMIHAWRYGSRDPYRRAGILDRVTQAYKGPLEKVKTTMDAFRDRTTSEELQSLTQQFRNENNDNGKDQASDTETTVPITGDGGLAESNGDEHDGVPRAPVSRSNSGASLVSMGQWSSPQKMVQPAGNRRREEAASLRYGSDHEEDAEVAAATAVSSAATAYRPSADDVEMATAPKKKKPAVVFSESWQAKQDRVRAKSAFGNHPGWRLLPILVKANDDLRQEQLASQLIYRMAAILSRERIPVWLCPYEIVALTDSAGIIEAIPDTISLDSLKRNDPKYSGLKNFFQTHFQDGKEFSNAQANFVESLAAYSVVCFLLQLKDRHNGNILLDNHGHIIHIDFGFFFLSSPGKNAGFESAPFKLTRDFCDVMDGPNSRLFRTFRELCVKTFITLRKHCMEIILLVEMLKNGNEELPCFCGRPDEAIQGLRDRFRLDLNDRACKEYVQSLIDDSIENWRTDWYDRYQRYFVGVL